MSASGGGAVVSRTSAEGPGLTHLRHAPLWISAVHIGHKVPFRCWQFSVLMMEVECRTACSIGDGNATA